MEPLLTQTTEIGRAGAAPTKHLPSQNTFERSQRTIVTFLLTLLGEGLSTDEKLDFFEWIPAVSSASRKLTTCFG